MNRFISRAVRCSCWLLVGLVALIAAQRALAADQNVVFTIDPTVSTLNVTASGGGYGTFTPTFPGSNTTFVDGHFLVNFDTSNDTPTSINFVGGDGFYEQKSPVTLQTSNYQFSYSNLSWDFSTPTPISGSNGDFPATTSKFTLWSGTLTEKDNQGNSSSGDESGFSDKITTGTWTLKESAPGSGDWSLAINGTYVNGSASSSSVQQVFTLSASSTAHFGAANVTSVAPTDTHADVLGGASTPGGVSIDLSGTSAGGTLTAQQIPNLTGLSEQAVAAAASNPVFAASTSTLSANPQIWTVDYTGLLSGQSATLVFNYDPSLLPAGFDQTQLGIWHFNSNTGAWEFGGTVNTTDHTITFVTTSFSPFALGTTAVPEPATLLLAALGLISLVGLRRCRRRPQAAGISA